MNAVVVGRISARLGDRTMSNVGLVSLVAGFALVPFVHDLALLSVTMLLFAFGMALTNTGITALISNAASDREQGTVLGASSSLDSLSGILAPPVSTGLLSAYGSRLCRNRVVHARRDRARDRPAQRARRTMRRARTDERP